MLTWWREGDQSAKRALIAASMGWMLDAFDVVLYSLVLKSLMRDLHLDSAVAGTVQSMTLLAAAAGGLTFGVIADRYGRTRALMASVLIYSVFTFACGFARTAAELTVFRICLGLGMGGEWASGAALVAETWPDHVRGRAMGFMQSSWAIGSALAVVVAWLVQDVLGFDWRVVFFVGVFPAFITLWIRRYVSEPAVWRAARQKNIRVPIREVFGGPLLRVTIAITLMHACALFAWWGFNTWIPAYLSLPVEQGGIGLSNRVMSALVFINYLGMWCGYVAFGFICDALGRRRTYVSFLLIAAAFVWAYTSMRNPWALLALGPVTAFFATGHFSGFAPVTAELYPTHTRATAQGFTYNLGRIASAAAPFMVGSFAKVHGYSAALGLTGTVFVVAASFWIFIPETKGRAIQ